MNTNNDTTNIFLPTNNLIRTMCRGSYDLQKTRIMFGNRITLNFKTKLGLKTDGMSEAQLASAEKKILDDLRKSYMRITDGVVNEGRETIEGKLPSPKKFVGDSLITTYTELILVDQYMTILNAEEQHFHKLKKLMKGIPIYDEFLSGVTGCGTAMSAVIISEINIHAAEYPSSLHVYAGLDCVTIGKYTDEAGKEHIIPAREIDVFYNEAISNDPHSDKKITDFQMLAHDKYPVTFESVGRSKKEYCLVKKEYVSKEGDVKVRDSITYNPFLKTKLIGVLGGSFLKAGNTFVDGAKMGTSKRLELAEKLGFKKDTKSEVDVKEQVITFLRNRDYTIDIEYSKYGKTYYEYKNRIQNMPVHKEKTPLHIHNMAIRYMVKRFLIDLYTAYRKLENLPVATEYAEGKLGIIHKVATEGK